MLQRGWFELECLSVDETQVLVCVTIQMKAIEQHLMKLAHGGDNSKVVRVFRNQFATFFLCKRKTEASSVSVRHFSHTQKPWSWSVKHKNYMKACNQV